MAAPVDLHERRLPRQGRGEGSEGRRGEESEGRRGEESEGRRGEGRARRRGNKVREKGKGREVNVEGAFLSFFLLGISLYSGCMYHDSGFD